MANYIVALTTPVLIAKSTFGAYYFFAFSTLLTTIVITFCMYGDEGAQLGGDRKAVPGTEIQSYREVGCRNI